jgi:hypothetical protein
MYKIFLGAKISKPNLGGIADNEDADSGNDWMHGFPIVTLTKIPR